MPLRMQCTSSEQAATNKYGFNFTPDLAENEFGFSTFDRLNKTSPIRVARPGRELFSILV